MTADMIGFPGAPRLKDMPYHYGEERRFASALPIIEVENQKHELVKKGTDGRIVAPWSRAKNTHSNEAGTRYPFPKGREDQHNTDDRVVRLSTLYKLRNGPNQGKYMGSNIFDFSPFYKDPDTAHVTAGDYIHQRYAASEAPFDGADYYRMVMDNNMRVLVTLSNPKDERIACHKDEYNSMTEKERLRCERGGVSAELHLLSSRRKKITFDGYEVRYVSQTRAEKETGIVVKTYEVIPPVGKPFALKHIIYPKWVQYGASGEKGPLCIIDHINKAQAELFKADGRGMRLEDFGIAVNCVYGCGRTNTVILMHQIEKMTMDLIRKRSASRRINRKDVLEELEFELRVASTADIIVDARGMRRTIASLTISRAAAKQIGELEVFPREVVLRELALLK